MGIFKMFGRDREPLRPKPRLEEKQTNLKDFNIENHNNSNGNVMDYLDVDNITLERGGVHDE
jgi:hypothetical protein